MAGSKMFLAHDVEQTMDTSIGVTLMFRKPCFSRVKPSRAASGELEHWLGGSRTFKIGCKKVE